MANVQDGATAWPEQPVVLEINTWVWLSELSAAEGRRVDLATVPAGAWDAVALPGTDAVWLMGVWARSPAGSVIARRDPGVRAELEAALGDLTDEDIVGSPYSVRSYSVDARLGGDEGLAVARRDLAQRGVRLLVDYVPNHVARDHAWVTAHPGYLVQGSAADLAANPDDFVQAGDVVVALGRDPFFPPWTDVVQLNAFSPGLREATTATLHTIAQRADGVRCDMAMLLLNEVFASTWGHLAGTAPAVDFWEPIIRAVREAHPEFLFVAEAYWDMEPQLLEQGFDYCYDKRLYDRVLARNAAGLRAHLGADAAYQRRMVRFIENHDEQRSALALEGPYLRSAAVAVCTLPGALLVYEGQAEGRTQRPPVQLARRPREDPDADLRSFYEQLFAWLARSRLRTGRWALLEVAPAPPAAGEGLVAWAWDVDGQRYLVVVNLGGRRSTGRVRLPWHDLGDREGDREVEVAEVLAPARYRHDAAGVARDGLYVDVGPGGFHILSV